MQPFICLAPIQGMTNYVYRNCYVRFFSGVDEAMAPYLAANTNQKAKPSFIKDLFPEYNTSLPVIPQILGNDADSFTNVANKLHHLGYSLVNWNLGCPFARVAKKKRGSGMLPYPDKILDILDFALSKMEIKLSLKVRLGRKESSELFKLLPKLDKYPLTEIIIHPRTGIQLYKGEVDLDSFEKCLTLTKHKVVYNGDIYTIDDYNRLQKRFPGINKWMLGRGILINPFLPAEIKGLPLGNRQEQLIILRAFHDELFTQYESNLSGFSHLGNKMKEVWTYMSKFFNNPEKIMIQLKRISTREKYLNLMDDIFSGK